MISQRAVKEIHEKKVFRKCPVDGCIHHWVTIDGLWGHLLNQHRKEELIRTIIRLMGELEDRNNP